MSERHDARERAEICKDCWFWKEMACALPNPVNGVCANKRPIRARNSIKNKKSVEQAPLIPLAQGHSVGDFKPTEQVASARPERPFAPDDPEATFSIQQVRNSPASPPPKFREIRARQAAAAAAARPLESAVSIPVNEVESGTLISDAEDHYLVPAIIQSPAASVLPDMEQLRDRVRRRTAARIAQSQSARQS